MTDRPIFVFVHGTHSSSSSWNDLVNELTLRGHRCVTVDLPGHGTGGFFPRAYQAPQDLRGLATEPSPLATRTLDEYVDHTIAVVRRASEHGPVILVGASQGGVTLSRVGNAVPELLERLVYVSAYCCVDLPSMAAYFATPENGDSLVDQVTKAVVGDPAVLGVARVNWRTADPGLIAGIKECLAAGFTDDATHNLLNHFQPDEPAAIPLADARGHADTWGRIPRTYVRFTADRLIPPALQNRFITEADRLTPDNPTDIRDVPAPHAGPMSRPELVAILDSLASPSEQS
ncbi:pimeloyl-ACP methyl ester carboxylesterase [Kribbella aluminosa]|uniref:Pimeloyl-ACP methyl ester carboxylesterase n=1 Tax=Kribbella aluminosa TaxID=416017 RepID=A0ABS4UMX8_9ACTN|nr:alpha/beta fold hydrolase [Kribbella aluminosa]MBP2353003.1 pimeloyl-ACP methyl ester carboxylesterase [Kribbella aluminosa]